MMNHRIKGGEAWIVKVAILALLSAAALRAQSGFPVPAKEDYLEVTRNLGLTLDNRLQTLDSLVAWVTPDSIKMASVGWVCALDLCGRCRPILNPLPGIALPGPRSAAPPPFSLTRYRQRAHSGHVLNALAAFVMPDGMLYHYALGLPALSSPALSIRKDSAQVSLKAGQSPRVIAVQPSPWDIFRSEILIGGTGRLLQISGWSAESGLGAPGPDPFTPTRPLQDDWVSYGAGWFGGSNGGTYTWGSDIPPGYESTGISGPVRILDATGALGDNGWVAVRESGGWRAFHIAPGVYRDFRIVRDGRGLGVLRYPPTGDPFYASLRDEPTRFASIEVFDRPFPIGDGTPRAPLFSSVGAPPVRITFADSEDNYTPLRMDLFGTQGDSLALGNAFVGTAALGACEGPGICIQPGKTLLTVSYKPDSLVLAMTVQSTSVSGSPPCTSTKHEMDKAWMVATRWRDGGRLRIRIGGKDLELQLQTPDGIKAPSGSRTQAVARDGGSNAYDAAGRWIAAPEGRGKASAARRLEFR